MKYEAVVIGASLGGMEALRVILAALPQNFPVPILIVQHLSSRPDSFLAKYLNDLCQIGVKEADEKEKIISGNAYLAPPNYHLMIEQDGCLALSVDEKVNYSRPSIDVLFESAAYAYDEKLIGIILTGSNADGAIGLKCIKERGGLTIVQEPRTAEASSMPNAAIKTSKVDYVLPLCDIGQLLNHLVGRRK